MARDGARGGVPSAGHDAPPPLAYAHDRPHLRGSRWRGARDPGARSARHESAGAALVGRRDRRRPLGPVAACPGRDRARGAARRVDRQPGGIEGRRRSPAARSHRAGCTRDRLERSVQVCERAQRRRGDGAARSACAAARRTRGRGRLPGAHALSGRDRRRPPEIDEQGISTARGGGRRRQGRQRSPARRPHRRHASFLQQSLPGWNAINGKPRTPRRPQLRPPTRRRWPGSSSVMAAPPSCRASPRRPRSCRSRCSSCSTARSWAPPPPCSRGSTAPSTRTATAISPTTSR